jgi:hypothetical protein
MEARRVPVGASSLAMAAGTSLMETHPTGAYQLAYGVPARRPGRILLWTREKCAKAVAHILDAHARG